ncbi:hypothetical protein [Sphingomonas sp. LY160]|uniref:hypothetical protein n=1 Tax=Sphingomonas sp. LY160 TaxID=3095342 RepID=UPI002ADEEE50|nr:hypothetical protein [Sphingomonas sp. LY160]MEA1071774.1 hypothetical protein [Sphingomonas sp. LY160]
MGCAKQFVAILIVGGIGLGALNFFEFVEFSSPPTTEPIGSAVDDGLIIKKETTDWEAILRSTIQKESSFLTLTVKEDRMRDQLLEKSIKYTPFPSSRARVRVNYHVEYPIGYNLKPTDVTVSSAPNGLILTLQRPQLIAAPSVILQSYKILERGILLDEKVALLELQQRIQPEVARRAQEILGRPNVLPESERALGSFLKAIMAKMADQGEPPPHIQFIYR